MRWIFRILGIFVVLVVGAVAAFFLLPADRIGAFVEERFEASTGRALSIQGDVRPGLWPEIGIKTGPVTIANADWAGETPMVEAEGLSVGVAWQGLFGGDIRVTGVELIRPTIRLVQNAEGQGNWDLGSTPSSSTDTTATGSGDASETATNIALDQATITDGTVSFETAGAAPITVSGIGAILTLPDYAGLATLSLTASANGTPVATELSIERFAAFLEDGAVPIDLALTIGGDRIAFGGLAGLQPLSAEGQINAELAGLEALTKVAGASTSLPAGLGQDRIALAGALTYAGDTLSLREAKIDADSNSLAGDLDLTLAGARPKLVANLSAGPLDLSGATGDSGGSGGSGDVAQSSDQSAGWSTDPIDVSGLGAMDAEIALTAPSITLSQSQLGRTSARVVLDNSRLVTTIRELNAYDGSVAGEIVVNGRNGLSASADLKGSAIAISRLFAELLDFDKLVTLGDMEIRVLTSGTSMNALMNGLNGEGSFGFGAGELLGLDLVGMLRNLDPSLVGAGASTIFDEITGTFRIVDGVVINENLSMLAPLFTATGAGQVGLGGQTLDYRIVPKLLGDDGISVPVIVSGSWSAPRFRLDLEGLVSDRAEAELKAAQDELEEKAKAKVLEKVGAEAGADPEKAVKKKLENELKKGLKGLFD